MDIEQLERLNDAEQKFDKACQQIIVLDQQVRDLETLYKRAVKSKKNAFRYNLRLKLSVITGVKMMYHHYAGTQAEEISRVRRILSGYFENNNDSESDTPEVGITEIQQQHSGDEHQASSSISSRESGNSGAANDIDLDDTETRYNVLDVPATRSPNTSSEKSSESD